MAKKGLKVWRAMPQARRQNLRAKGVDTRREKAQFGRQLARSRREGTPGPTAKGVAGKGGPNQRRRGRGAGEAPEVGEAATGGVRPRGAQVERTRKTTTASGKVGVTRTGVTSGGPGPEAYRQVAPSAAGGGKAGKKGVKGKGAKKGLLGRKRGAIRKPGKGGPGKRLIAKGGGGRGALQTWRALPQQRRQTMLKSVRKPGGNAATQLVQRLRQVTQGAPRAQAPKAQPKTQQKKRK